jgi:hydrogenase maturation factor
MCRAVPAKITAINGDIATVDMLGNTTTADISLLENVFLGDKASFHHFSRATNEKGNKNWK